MEKPWTQDDVRSFALGLPEVHESSHQGRPDLRVGGRIFATLPEDGRTVNVKTTPLRLDMLLRSGDMYRDVWGGRWVGVELAKVPEAELRELLVAGYCLAASKSLASIVRNDSRYRPPAVLDVEEHERRLERAELLEDVAAAEEHLARGGGIPTEEAKAELRRGLAE